MPRATWSLVALAAVLCCWGPSLGFTEGLVANQDRRVWRTPCNYIKSRRHTEYLDPVGLKKKQSRIYEGGRLRTDKERVLTLQDDIPVEVPKDPVDPLPWSRETTEVMIDGHSIIRWYMRKARDMNTDLQQMSDRFSWWPIRPFMIAQLLAKDYGKECPPSPWDPVTVVYDVPDPGSTWSGLQVKRYRDAYREGPHQTAGVTLAFAQTYVDRSAAQVYRCDKEILYMLELLMRDFPRRQVLVTASAGMKKQAEKYCTVRGPEWLEAEILQRHGKRGKDVYQALMGGPQGVNRGLKALPRELRLAFTAA